MYQQTQQKIQELQQQGVFPGAVYSLRSSRQEITQALGWQSVLPEKQVMPQEAIFDVASLTKVVCTTTVVLRLLEKGKLQLDQPLQRYLPTFQDPRITLRHLLTHTSDIQTWIPDRDRLNATQLRAAYLQLSSGPGLGQVVHYTDAGTILLGFMLEQLLQKPVIKIFQEEVLQPLAMSDSYFLPDKSLYQRIVPTEKLPNGQILRGVTHDPKARILRESAGNAGLFTTLADMGRFSEMLLAWGGDYLQQSTLQQLLQDQTPTGSGGRSLGWDLRWVQDQPILYHTGYTGTFLLVDPLQQEWFIFLSNRLHPENRLEEYLAARDELIDIYLSEKVASQKK